MWVVLEDLLREIELELTLKDQREIKLEKKEKGISINSWQEEAHILLPSPFSSPVI